MSAHTQSSYPPPAPADVRDPSASASATIWVVDDSPLQAELTRRSLATRHEIVVYDTAAAMLERLANGARPDLLVLDWHMPEMSGLDACRFVRKSVDGAVLPIIILTATGHRSHLLDGLAAGANDFINKPVDAAELHARVDALVRTKRLYAQLTQTEIALRAEHVKLTETEAELRAEASFRESFLAILAHDLRQPLNIVALGSETLAASGTSQEVRDRVASHLVHASARMQRMIGELLDFSRARPAGGMPITRQPMDLALVATNVVEEIRLAHPARRIDLFVMGSCKGSWDSDRMAQVVGNLVENALAHSAADSFVSIAITAAAAHVKVDVENHGDPIAPDLLPTIFDAFRRGSVPRHARGGLGLGLYIVAQIVKAHDGTVTARSDGGRTRFEVTLPTPS